jgi:simple sugar transport system ATP-binding protein
MSSPTTASEPRAVVEARGLGVTYGHVHALRDGSLRLMPGRITALIGDNGAGKSTLVRLIAGIDRQQTGELLVDGAPVRFRNPAQARAAGIETVHQNLALAPDLTAAENLFLGRERPARGLLGRLGFLDDRTMRREAHESLLALQSSVAHRSGPVAGMSGGQQQAVAVAKAAHWARRVIILDEPTAALGATQSAAVYELIRAAAARGLAILLISHDLPEVIELADDVTVMRHGATVAHLRAADTTAGELLDLMMGVERREGDAA